MVFLYDTIIYNPLLNTLVFLYNTVAAHDLGIAIIFLTIIIRLILYPLFHKSAKYQKKMQIIQPKLREAQEKHKNDRAKQTEVMMALYKEHNLNPFSGFLFLLVQLPILFAVYRIFLKIFTPEILNGLYSFVSRPPSLNPMFLGLINLGSRSILMVVLAAIGQYFQAKLALPAITDPKDPAARMARQMMFLGPIFTLLIFSGLPAAVSLYWVVASLFSIGQQIIINKTVHGKLE